MNDDLLFKTCYDIACESHAGQFREDGKPYITHIDAVIWNTREYFSSRAQGLDVFQYVYSVAALHDVLEDCPFWESNENKLGEEIFKRVGKGTKLNSMYFSTMLLAVKLLTKKPRGEEEYSDYLFNIKNHKWAQEVKIADLRHNLSDLKPCSRRDKYTISLAYLAGEERAKNILTSSQNRVTSL